jgi:hypothetical protein
VRAVALWGAAGDAHSPPTYLAPLPLAGLFVGRRESIYNRSMPDRLSVSALTVAQLIARSADYAAKARTATTADIRNALDRLAARYAVLAAQRMPAMVGAGASRCLRAELSSHDRLLHLRRATVDTISRE